MVRLGYFKGSQATFPGEHRDDFGGEERGSQQELHYGLKIMMGARF